MHRETRHRGWRAAPRPRGLVRRGALRRSSPPPPPQCPLTLADPGAPCSPAPRSPATRLHPFMPGEGTKLKRARARHAGGGRSETWHRKNHHSAHMETWVLLSSSPILVVASSAPRFSSGCLLSRPTACHDSMADPSAGGLGAADASSRACNGASSTSIDAHLHLAAATHDLAGEASVEGLFADVARQ